MAAKLSFTAINLEKLKNKPIKNGTIYFSPDEKTITLDFEDKRVFYKISDSEAQNGLTPYINEKGNWQIGDEDTGVKAAGSKGEKGDKGDPGKDGAQGAQGKTGPQGPKGDKGDTGLTGPTGPQGVQGPKGDQGIQGPKGDTGEQGPQGIPGEKGADGKDGAQGPKGEPGVNGTNGTNGTNGKDGLDGKTPVKGVDYWNANDIAEIHSYIDTQLGVIENGTY